jgi:hypothetical protein
LIVARDLGYFDQEKYVDLSAKANEIGFLLHRLYTSLSNKNL